MCGNPVLNLELQGQLCSFLACVQISSALNLGSVMLEVGKSGWILMERQVNHNSLLLFVFCCLKFIALCSVRQKCECGDLALSHVAC